MSSRDKTGTTPSAHADNDNLPGHQPVARPGAEPVRPLPKRFYTAAGVSADGPPFRVLLDGRTVRTPAKSELAVPTLALATALAEEWERQLERIDPATMPLTRIANTALDGVALHADAVRAEIANFAGNDLLCYRAESPADLVARQEAAWAPVLAWAGRELGVTFNVTTGLMPIDQPADVTSALADALARVDALPLAALHVVTTLTGSALLALALFRGQLDAARCWQAAHIDEDWQITQWGADEEAAERRQRRWQEMEAAARIIALHR